MDAKTKLYVNPSDINISHNNLNCQPRNDNRENIKLLGHIDGYRDRWRDR